MKNDDRLKLLKAKKEAKAKERNARYEALAKTDFSEVVKGLERLAEIVGEKPDTDGYVERIVSKLNELDFLNEQLQELRVLTQKVVDKEVPKDFKVTNFDDVIKTIRESKTELPKWLSKDITSELNTNLKTIADLIEKQTVKKQGQDPTDFIPIRRVKPLGTRLVFDDSTWMGGGGGGGGIQDSLISGGAVKVTGNLTATVDTTGLATSTKQSDGSQKSQIVDSGGEAATVTGGKLDVNASVDTTGLATDARQDTGNTSLASIDTKTPALGQALAAASTPVVLTAAQLTTLTPPAAITGFATSAKQDTIIGHVDGIEGLLTSIESDTDTLEVVGGGTEAAALRVTIANDSTGVLSVDDNGGSLTVDNAGLTELAAAINSSKLDINLVSSDVSMGGGEQHATNEAYTDADLGTVALIVRDDALTTLTEADGDYSTLRVTSVGRLWTSAVLDSAIPAGNNNIGDVDVASSALPTGASTSAKQDTIIGHVDGIEGLLTTIDADTGNIATSVAGLALETGGNLATIAGAIRAEDVASGTGHTGIPAMVIRQDTPGATSNSDGDYEMLQVAGGRLWVDASGKTLTVASHAVTNAGTFAVQSTNQAGDNTIGRVKLTDGTDVADILDLTNANPLTVAILDGDGTQITSFGGGTQYTEADTDASITGTAILWEDTSDTLRAVSASKPLPVGDGGGSLTVDGSVTANAGTNLNTSLLALESGGNLAGAATSLAIMDDWDESDRAKVNPIAGQAGVQGASGTVTALTQRVVLATDVALPAGTNAIGKLASNSGVTIGAVEIAASQSVAVTQATAASLNATVVGTGTFAVQNTPVAPTTVLNGNKNVTTAGTRVTLASSTTCKSVTIKAKASNTGTIYVGDTSVASTNGYALAPGEVISMDIANLSTVNLDSSVNGEGVTYVAVN